MLTVTIIEENSAEFEYLGMQKGAFKETVYELHIGESYEGPYNVPSNARLYIQADADELDFITRTFEGIRKAYNLRVVTWTDDDARFILANLKSLKRKGLYG